MRVQLIAVGTRMPTWVRMGYEEYAARLPRECELRVVEIPAAKRVKSVTLAQVLHREGERMLAAIPHGAHVMALDVGGQQWTTEQLAGQLNEWLHDGRDVSLLVGGPEGLDAACRTRAETLWSLSKLTFPHPLVRIIVAEQLYRAWSLLHNHPYHRA